jgi:transcriptional regulator with XRE-family HTH domain
MKEPENMGERIEELMRAKRFKINALANKIGISGQGLRDILKGKSISPGVQVINKLAEEFNVSVDYLVNGIGTAESMTQVKESLGSYGTRMGINKVKRERPIPFVPVRTFPSFIQHYPNLNEVEDLQYFSLPGDIAIRTELIAFEVEGESMMPELKSGSVVVCSAETGNLRYLLSGSIYGVLYAGHFSIKRVINHIDNEGMLELQSSNDKYTPMKVSVNDVQQIWRAILSIHSI